MNKEHKKILWVIGTRPNYMKLFKHPNQVVVNTGQHYSDCMSHIFLRRKGMPLIKYNLEKTKLGEMTDGLVDFIKHEHPKYVVVPGDTNSALAGALAASECGIPIIHLEAGLRSFDMKMPEERNRVLIDKLSQVWLCPSQTAVMNLENEGINFNVFNVGSNMVDACFSEFPTQEIKEYPKYTYRLLTLHRQYAVDNKDILAMILKALGETGEKFVWPIHPRTKKNIEKFKLEVPKNIEIIDPVDHKTMVWLEAFATQVVTDSGGVQVESYFLRRPIITIRNETEWIETVRDGWNVVTGYDSVKIKAAIKNHLPSVDNHNTNAYGAGMSNMMIKEYLASL